MLGTRGFRLGASGDRVTRFTSNSRGSCPLLKAVRMRLRRSHRSSMTCRGTKPCYFLSLRPQPLEALRRLRRALLGREFSALWVPLRSVRVVFHRDNNSKIDPWTSVLVG